MSTPATEPQASVPAPEPVDSGLRSVDGIRWLLLIGAAVVVVSLVRLVAGHWGLLPQPVQFLTLCAGALGVYGAGETARRRLRLPVASGALFGLFAVAVPVLAWGAARGELTQTSAGAAAFFVGLGALIAAVRRLLSTVYGYRGHLLTASFALFVGTLGLGVPGPAWIPAVVLGGVLAAACRHVNCFFFHRDRVQGIERPVDALPFVALVGLYLANVIHLAAGSELVASAAAVWSLALTFVAFALADAGEEYFRALTRAAGRMPSAWPRRSVGLLGLGFSVGAVAVGLAFASREPAAVVWSTGVAAAYLMAWSFRYRLARSYAVALPLGLVALHTLPALFPQLRDRCVELASAYFGYSGLTGVASAAAGGETALLACLALGAVALRLPRIRPRVTESMVDAHAWVFAVLASWNLAISLVGTAVTVQVAPAVSVLCLVVAFALRRAPLLFPAHLGLLAGAFAWTGGLEQIGLTVLPLAVINALVSTIAWAGVVRRDASTATAIWAFLGPVLTASLLVPLGFVGLRLGWIELQTLPWILGLGTVPALLVGLRANQGIVTGAATAVLTTAVQWGVGLAWPAAGGTSFVVANALLVVAFWTVLRFRGRELSHGARGALWAGWGTGSFLGALFVGGVFLSTASPVGATLAAAAFLAVTGASWVDLALFDPRRRSRGRARVGLWILATVPGAALAALLPVTVPAAAQAVLWVASLWLLRRRLTAPSTVYRIERLYAGSPEKPSAERVIRHAASSAYDWGSKAGVALSAWVLSPWTTILLTGVLADALLRRNDDTTDAGARAGSSVERPVVGLLWVAHVALVSASSQFLPTALLQAVVDGTFALPRFLAAFLLWQRVFHRDDTSPIVTGLSRGVEAVAAGLCLFALPSGWAGILTLALLSAFVVRHAVHAWRDDDRIHSRIAQGWLWIGLVGLRRLAFFDLPEVWPALAAVAAAFGLRAAREALESRDRPRVAASLVAGGTLAALGGAWLGWAASGTLAACLPLFLASLYFALGLDDRHWETSVATAGFLFVVGWLRLLWAMPFLGPEGALLGPGLALLATARLLRRRIGKTWSLRLLTVGAGCLYAVPMLALLRELTWGSQILLLVMSIGFGALSFQWRSRSLLIVSTGAALVDLGFFLFLISRTPILLWILGVVFGLGLMAVAAFLESRREQALQQARLWGEELRSWT